MTTPSVMENYRSNDTAMDNSPDLVEVMRHVRTLNSLPEKGPDLWAMIKDVKTSLFLDSGAEVNLVKETFLRSLPHNSYKFVQGDPSILNSVSNQPLSVTGLAALQLTVGDVDMQIEAYIVTDVNFPANVLVGRPTLVDYRIRPVFDENVIFIGNNIVPMHVSGTSTNSVRTVNTSSLNESSSDFVYSPLNSESTEQSFYFSTSCPAYLTRKVTLYRNTATKVTLRLDTEHLQTVGFDISSPDFQVTCISEPATLKVEGVQTDEAVHQTNTGTFVTYISNRGKTPVRLKEGAEILSCSLLKGDLREIALKEFNVSFVSKIGSDSESVQTPPSQPDFPLLESDMLQGVDLPRHREALKNLLNEFRDTIALPGEPLGRTDMIDHHITLLPGVTPIYVPAYRLPHSQRQLAEELVQEMLRLGVVEPSKSPWNFPLVLVPKKDGTWRPVIDYRKLNAVTQPDRFPIPVLSELLHSLGKNRIFSTLDLRSGFWQIPLSEASKPLTAFSTPSGHYQFVMLPFGLHSSPGVFSRLMQLVFQRLIGKEILVYMDDIIVMSPDVQTHFIRLKHVLELLRTNNLKLKLSKCVFLKTTIKYLGHTVSAEGITPNADKVEAILNFPTPRSVTELQSFLGLAGFYRSYVENFSRLAVPLTALTRKNVPFEWKQEQQEAFDYLRSRLLDAPILVFPDYDLPFVIYTDASDYAVGAALMQMRGSKLHPIAYFSKQMNSAQRNYSTTDKEALGVVLALKHFRPYIFGYHVTVYTDHQPLMGIFKGNHFHGRLARWSLIVQEYNPDFKYVPGKANRVADCLSRIVASVTTYPSLDEHDLKRKQRSDPLWGKVIQFLEGTVSDLTVKTPVPVRELYLNNDVLCRDVRLGSPSRRVTQLVIPTSLIPNLLTLMHDTPQAGHPGVDRCYKQTRLRFYWPCMNRDIGKYVNECTVCHQHKGSTQAPLPVLQFPTPTHPWERVSMDLLGPLNLSLNGNKYILVCIDAFTRFCELVPLPNKTAKEVAKAFKERILDRHGSPRVLITDNGTEFNNTLMEQLCSFYHVSKCNILPYHPASNGLSERLNRKVLNNLRVHINYQSDMWDECLSDVQGSINSSYHKTLKDTPFFALHGFDKRIPFETLTLARLPHGTTDEFLHDRLTLTQNVHQRIHGHLKDSTEEFTVQRNKKAKTNQIDVGDLVMLTAHLRKSKLSPKFWGPYRVVQHLMGHKFKLRHIDTDDVRVEHGDHLKVFPGHESEVANQSLEQAVDDDSAPLSSDNAPTTLMAGTTTDTTDTDTQTPQRLHGYSLRPRRT